MPIRGLQNDDDAYIRFLKARSDKIFYLKPYGGNAGDTLIRRGTETLLSGMNIRQTVDPRDADVLLMPGGNPALWPTVSVVLWRELWRNYPDREFVIGPSGLRGAKQDWAEAIVASGANVSGVFARDPGSYETLLGADLPSTVVKGLSHDPALNLWDSEWMNAHRRAATAEYVLIAIRNDREAFRVETPFDRALRRLPARVSGQLSKLRGNLACRRMIRTALARADAASTYLVLDAASQRVELFIETLRRAREVHTNRLHTMLAAVMLDKRVFAYEAAYDKLANVYNHSLGGCTKVTFVNDRSSAGDPPEQRGRSRR